MPFDTGSRAAFCTTAHWHSWSRQRTLLTSRLRAAISHSTHSRACLSWPYSLTSPTAQRTLWISESSFPPIGVYGCAPAGCCWPSESHSEPSSLISFRSGSSEARLNKRQYGSYVQDRCKVTVGYCCLPAGTFEDRAGGFPKTPGFSPIAGHC